MKFNGQHLSHQICRHKVFAVAIFISLATFMSPALRTTNPLKQWRDDNDTDTN